MGTGQPSFLIYKLPAKFWEANASLVSYWPQIQLCNLPTRSPATGDLSSSPLAFNFLILQVKQRTKRGLWVFTNSRNGTAPPQGRVLGHRPSSNRDRRCYLVANMARSEEKVAASSLRALSSLRSFIMVSVTMAFSFSYLLFRLARATSAVWGSETHRVGG